MLYLKIILLASLVIIILFSCQSPQPATNIKLPKLFTDHMVLQQEMNVPIWGTANPGGLIAIQFLNQKVKTVANAAGEWNVKLKPLKAGGPFELKIIGQDTIVIQDVLVGEVWIGSGQSNMEMPLAGWGQVLDFEKEIAEANYPNLRLFQVNRTVSLTPKKIIPADGWKTCTPENIPEFSSTAYFFGRKIHKELDLPIGLIHSSWGGTIVETWMSPQSLEAYPEFRTRISQLNNIQKRFEKDYQDKSPDQIFDVMMQEWYKELLSKDRGLKNPDGKWFKNSINVSNWKTMSLPANWENEGLPGLDGIVWFRKEVDLPASWVGKELTLHLSAVDDIDSTYFNGKLIGTNDVWDAPRDYSIPKDLVKQGKNYITVRVQDNQGGGGIWGDPDLLKISANNKSISLAGEWYYNIGLDWNELTSIPLNPNNPNHPTLLSNGMIEPLIPFAFRGAIWYQGESNAGRAYQYRTLFPGLLRDWRQRWGQGDFPFLFVQLANFMATKEEPEDDSWAELREAQFKTLDEPNTGMAVAIDIGDAEDIHPKNKQEVGRRLALNALKIAYNKDIIPSGPLYQSFKIEGNKIRLTFNNIGDRLKIKDGDELKGFAIAENNKKFYWAKAKIEGNEVVVWHPEIKTPVAVRYGWAANPICNLYNSADLPASPFRTDDWPGITGP